MTSGQRLSKKGKYTICNPTVGSLSFRVSDSHYFCKFQRGVAKVELEFDSVDICERFNAIDDHGVVDALNLEVIVRCSQERFPDLIRLRGILECDRTSITHTRSQIC